MQKLWRYRVCLTAIVCAALPAIVRAQTPIVTFVSVPDFINMDLQLDDPRLFDLTNARKAQLVAEIAASGPQASINPNVGNFVGTVENGYRGASQVLLEALAAENADFFTVSGDLLYTRWPKGSQLGGDVNQDANHIRAQADIYYDDWIESVATYAGFDLSDVYTIVGDHEVGDNDWGANKRPLIPYYREVYIDKVGNETTITAGGYVNAPPGFEGRTYAVQRNNLLLVGLDQFETFTSGGVYTNVGSQIASVKIDVTGAQLAWLENTLMQAENDPTIDHVIVMGHAPIAGRDEVKVGHSSGLKNFTGENGPLWQTLANHNVDLYLPGEVHDISMQMANDVLQVVTGTNIFQPSDAAGVTNIGFNLASPRTSEQNYMVVDVYEDRIDLTLKQIETKIWGNRGASYDPLNDDPYKNREARVAIATAEAGFQTVGTLTIDTSSGSPVYTSRTGLFISEWTFGAPINIDLNSDTLVDIVDAQRFKTYFQTSFTGLSAAEAFSRGDLNGDFLSNHADFRIFKVAYNDQVGEGALELAMATPEPSNMMLLVLCAVSSLAQRRKRRKFPPEAAPAAAAVLRTRPAMPPSYLLFALGSTLALTNATSNAAPVTGWVVVNPQTGGTTTKPLSNSSTASPVLGDGSEDSAATVAMYATISGPADGLPDVSLANGEQVTLSGFATMSGIDSSQEQFRWGLFQESSTPINAIDWSGFIACNSAGSSGGALRAKTAGDGTTFAQSGSAVTVQIARDGDDFVDETYHFSMSISRFNNEISIAASLTSAEDWSQLWSDIVLPTFFVPAPTLEFNRVGFLAGGPMHANRITFNNIDVAAAPIDALTLQVYTAGPDAGTVLIRNNRPQSFEIEYYDIFSDGGSLNDDDWTSLDAQEGNDNEFEGWEEATGNDEGLLSEYRLFSTLNVGPDSRLSLGKAFNVGGTEDLKFYVGLDDGSYLRGVVEYVADGLTGDFNRDQTVDAADYVVWRKGLGTTHIDDDYGLWRTNFQTAGIGGGAVTASLPEPTITVWLLGFSGVFCGTRARRRGAPLERLRTPF
jgi:hypothetical protein